MDPSHITIQPIMHWTPQTSMDAMEAIDLNNEAYTAMNRGDYKTALQKYKKATEMKVKVHGENSINVCISLSGLSDAYLRLGDLVNAKKEADRMLRIGNAINNQDQIRIAKEILADIEKETK